MKQKIVLFLLLCTALATAQITIIPDPVFEQVLIDQSIDSDGIVNGQIFTADALTVNALTIVSPYVNGNFEWIYSITGIEAFINLESLTVNITMIEELNVNSLVNLRYLDCVDNMLSSLDVSNNSLLEYLSLFMGGDVMPMNNISEIDLSNNPNINTLNAYGIDFINLKNGNNTANMNIDIGAGTWGMDPEYINGHTCIEVDNEAAAQAGLYPYSEWIVMHANQSYELVENCSLATLGFKVGKALSVYPNPASGILHLVPQVAPVEKVELYDTAGRLVREYNNVSESAILLTGVATGTYILKAFTQSGVLNARVVVQ